MRGIYYKEGIYVVIDSDEEHDDCVYHYNYKDDISLFGGRVEIDNNKLKVDGFEIVDIKSERIRSSLDISTITSHLNAIEVNGADAFIQNYKKSIEFVYQEIKDLSQKTELLLASEERKYYIEQLLSKLKEIANLLISVLAILFSLNSYMVASLENEKVISVCQSITDSFA